MISIPVSLLVMGCLTFLAGTIFGIAIALMIQGFMEYRKEKKNDTYNF